MILKDYPSTTELPDLKTVIQQLRDIARIRKDDITAAANLQNTYIFGRKTGRIPSSSADVIAGDKVGDFNVTNAFAYYLINNAGTATWVRVAVGSF